MSLRRQLFATRRLSHEDHAGALSRCLNGVDLMLLGVGAIIGSGIFVLTGIAAATQAGPAVVISYVIAGIACACAALSYAELSAAIGGSGSAYGYSYAAFGEIFAWIIGWDLLLEYGFTVAAVATGWSGYFESLLAAVGWHLPAALMRAPEAGGVVNLPAAGIVLMLMVLLAAGVRGSALTNHFLVVVKLATIAMFIAVAVFHARFAHLSPFMPFGWFGHDASGHPVGVLAAASIVFFAYIGFDAVSTAAEETRDPRRDLPYGILGSLALCTVIYVVVAGLLTAMVPYTELNVPHPVAHALELKGILWASGLVSLGATAGLTSVMLVCYYALTRIIFAMSRDGLLPAALNHMHPRTRTPMRVIVGTGLVMATIAGLLPLGELAELVNIGTLFAFVMVCVGVIVLRVTQPDMPRPFRTPGGILIPLLGAVMCFALMVFLPTLTWLRFLVWLAIGLVVYFLYSVRHSRFAALSTNA